MSNTNKTVVVTIGRNIGKTPIIGSDWRKFSLEVRELLRGTGLEIISEPAHNLGGPKGQHGVWDGVVEDSAVFIATGNLSHYDNIFLTIELNHLREQYQQDAIGFIVAPANECLITGV